MMIAANKTQKIRRITVIGLSLLFSLMSFSLLSGQQTNETQSEINQIELISKLEYDSKSGIFYYISAQESKIVINLRFMDETLQKKVLLYGLQVYVDPKNKKKKDLSIRYPLGQNNQQEDNNNLRLDYSELKAMAANPIQEIELCGFERKKEISYSYTHNKEGIHGSMEFDEMGSMFYQLVVPVTEIPGLQSNLDLEFSIGLETGHQELPMNPSAMENMGSKSAGGGRAGGGGGRAGGGSKGGTRGSGLSQGQPRNIEGMTQADKLWVKDLILK